MKTGFFEEKPDVKSSTRLNSFLLLICFFIFNTIFFLNGDPIEMNLILFDFILLLGIFAPKYLHKLAESQILRK